MEDLKNILEKEKIKYKHLKDDLEQLKITIIKHDVKSDTENNNANLKLPQK